MNNKAKKINNAIPRFRLPYGELPGYTRTRRSAWTGVNTFFYA
jgi:hypothetical protein